MLIKGWQILFKNNVPFLIFTNNAVNQINIIFVINGFSFNMHA